LFGQDDRNRDKAQEEFGSKSGRRCCLWGGKYAKGKQGRHKE
jgi:hypothetical protein